MPRDSETPKVFSYKGLKSPNDPSILKSRKNLFGTPGVSAPLSCKQPSHGKSATPKLDKFYSCRANTQLAEKQELLELADLAKRESRFKEAKLFFKLLTFIQPFAY